MELNLPTGETGGKTCLYCTKDVILCRIYKNKLITDNDPQFT